MKLEHNVETASQIKSQNAKLGKAKSCDAENHAGGPLGIGRTGWGADSWQEVIYNGGGTGMKGAEEWEELESQREEI